MRKGEGGIKSGDVQELKEMGGQEMGGQCPTFEGLASIRLFLAGSGHLSAGMPKLHPPQGWKTGHLSAFHKAPAPSQPNAARTRRADLHFARP